AVSESLRSARDQVPDHIGLEQDLARGLVVKADSSQLRQLVSNLLRNAIEAIGERSGTIRIRTWMHDVAAEGCAVEFPGKRLPRGRYASLEVTDTGGGMDRARRAKIFEPFFTTKFLGRGLGRAAVAGIVAAHKGGIQVESDPAGRAALFACTCRSRNPLDRSHVTPW
ncbi:MAG: hypothetical protein FJW37_09015, partial [Acidobacteria bacterium]|nr:hypothetical protein [Acidobacteriota bacterium]